MNNWCTINEGTSISKKAGQGAQLEKLIQTYEEALKLHQKGNFEEAKVKYKQLIDDKILKKEAKTRKDKKEDDKEEDRSPLLSLFFVVVKNYASVLEEEYKKDQDMELAKEALQYYLEAIEIDPTAYSIWYPMGCLSRHLKNLRFARLAYENGIFTDNEKERKSVLDIMTRGQFTPTQWRCFEGLCSVLYEIGDYFTCRHYVESSLNVYSEWTLGQTLLENIKREDSVESMDVDEQELSIKPIIVTVEKADASLLIEKLLTLYKKQHTSNNAEEEIEDGLLETNIDINNTLFVHNVIKVLIEKDDVDTEIIEAQEEHDVLPDPPLPETVQPSTVLSTVTDQSLPYESTLLAHEDPERLQKRKRDELHNTITGEEDESDQEDKKTANLRASRRKKEKFLNTEASRIKMIEEETQFDLKIQNFHDTLRNIPNLYKDQPWHLPRHESLSIPPHFWDWFDIKINELESTYSWDMDAKRGERDLSEHNSKGKGLTLFAFNYAYKATKDHRSSSIIKKTIMDINTDNSGVIDSLCKLVMTVIKEDMLLNTEDTTVISSDFLELLIETINSLEMNFTQCLSHMNDFEKTLATLRVCEHFLDKLVRTIMIATQESGIPASYKKKASNMLSKHSKVKQIEVLMETTKLWMSLVESSLFSMSLSWFGNNVTNEAPENNTALSDEEQKIELRYWMIQGKLAQCQDDIQSALACYKKCKSILESNILLKGINTKSMYDSFIDLKSIEDKLSLLQVGGLLIDAKEKSDEGDFSAVVEAVAPLVSKRLDTNTPNVSDETIQMMILLAKSYLNLKEHTKAWDCYRQLLCYIVKQMVGYGSLQFQTKSILCKDEDVMFSTMGKRLGDVMDDLLIMTEDPKSNDWLPKEFDQEFVDILKIIMRMALYYVFRHPDFVPLVNNFSSPDSIPHTPSRITKSNRFNGIAVKSWIMYSLFIKRELVSHTKDAQKIMLDWTKLLQELHDELGEREICCSSNNVFLLHLLNSFFETSSRVFRKDIYQCYHCIYGVHLGAESDLIEEHYCTHSKLDQKSAEKLFKLVVTPTVKKLRLGGQLKGDLKDVVETVSELFEQLPYSEKQMTMNTNKAVIEEYLDSDLDVSSSSISNIYRKTLIPTVHVDKTKHDIPSVYYKIFWIRGKMLRLQIRNRPKISNEKNMADLESAIEEFTSHLVLNPDDGNAWYDLGICYHQLADEELNWSAGNIISHKQLIADYQKKACHAILRAIYLGGLTQNASERGKMFTQFGNLLYSMASAPMNMLAFEPKAVINSIGANGDLISTKKKTPETKSVYRFSLAIYIHALRYKISTESLWQCYYSTGKCFSKIGRPPTEVLGWYINSIQESRRDHPKELLIEPIYILCAALAKYLYSGQISAALALEYLGRERKLLEVNAMEEGHPSNPVIDENLTQKDTEHLPTDVAYAYACIFKRLLELIGLDTKGWHHRPLYRVAWMQYYIFRNPERAKAELTKLFTFKTTIKSHISIWKPNYELPGKHYVYVHKYTMFFIKLLKETRDDNTLEQLNRKIRRAPALLLSSRDVLNELTMPENTQ